MENRRLTQQLDQLLAAPMFALSIVVLGLFATILHSFPLEDAGHVVRGCLVALAILYPIYWAETVVHAVTGGGRLRQHLWFCLIPILRIGARDHDGGDTIWLPTMGWRKVDRSLERFLTRFFSVPMIVIALLVLPVIILEFFLYQRIESDPNWRTAIQVTVAFIWAAFTFEFVVMISIVKWPTNYARRHWIDLAIILLPLLAFLRAVRLTQLFRIKHLAKTGRLYRLRGLGLRMWRGFVALDFIDKLLSRNPERRLAKLESILEDKQHEMGVLEKDIARLKKRIAEKESKAAAQADQPRPTSPSKENSDDNSDRLAGGRLNDDTATENLAKTEP